MSLLVKTPYCVDLRRGHPLARGLAGAWLFNEGRGNTLWDVSGAGHPGTLTSMDPPTDWVAGPHGFALDFDGTNDRVIFGPDAGIDLGTANSCVVRCRIWPAGYDALVGHKSTADGGDFLLLSGGVLYYNANGGVGVTHGVASGEEVWLGVSRMGTKVTFYKNGVQLGTTQNLSGNNPLVASTIGAFYAGGSATNMRCDYVYCWRRALSAGEMAWLYREPFCFFGRRMELVAVGSAGGTIHNLNGTTAAVSSASGTATVIAASDLPTGTPWPKVTLGIEASWHREALLHGMTDTAMRLGTTLTQGWFWMRRSGCSAVYDVGDPNSEGRDPHCGCGPLVFVAPADAEQIVLPTYLSHEAGSTCSYVIRRFNACGQQDFTVGAVALVRIDRNGQLAPPPPNPVFAAQIRMSKCEFGHVACLEWFYCPLDQKATGRVFDIYWDAGGGDIDFVHPIAVQAYEGREVYRYQSQPLENGKYLFVVTAVSAAGAEGTPWKSEVRMSSFEIAEQMGILDAEAI